MKNHHDKLFDTIESMTLGFGPLFRDFKTASTNYPPHNIVWVSENEIRLELAVAGFKKSEISVKQHECLITIRGEPASDQQVEYQYKGIARRSFTKSFRIAEYYEVTEAKIEDGILSVSFVKNVPESAQPKTINIA